MPDSTLPPLPAPSRAANISWAEAHRRAQARISDLAVQRAQEAKSTSSISRLLGVPSLGAAMSSETTAKGSSFRVGQLDTELLDAELLELLKGQVWSAIKYFNPSFKETYETEFVALLRLVLFKLTIWDNNATYGAALQNLAYADARRNGASDTPPSRTQKTLYGLITVLGRYLYDKLTTHLLNSPSAALDFDESPFLRRLSRSLSGLTTMHSIASFVSLLTFLSNGRYRTLLDRLLRMKLVTPTRHVRREVSFEYLNRQLVWHAFTEFLLFILPIVGISRWRRWISKLWRKAVTLIRKSRGMDDEAIALAGAANNNGILGFLPERTCAICFSESSPEDVLNNPGGAGATASAGNSANDVTNPYEAVECGHVYCYVCLMSKIELEEGEGWGCLRCNAIVKRCRPWRSGVVGLTSFDERSLGADEGMEGGDSGAKSPVEEHGLEDIIESVGDDDDEDPINEELPEIVFAGGHAGIDDGEEDGESDGAQTERGFGGDDDLAGHGGFGGVGGGHANGGGYYMKGAEEDESNYNTADDGDYDEKDVRPWER